MKTPPLRTSLDAVGTTGAKVTTETWKPAPTAKEVSRVAHHAFETLQENKALSERCSAMLTAIETLERELRTQVGVHDNTARWRVYAEVADRLAEIRMAHQEP